MNDRMIVSLRPQQPAPEPEREEPRVVHTPRRRRRYPIKLFVLISVVAIILGVAAHFLIGSRGAPGSPPVDEVEASKEVKAIVDKVGELIVLPTGEEPTIATVSDPEKLKSQAFFKNAKVGYKVLIYTKAQKAYLYDPEAHKLIEVAPLSLDIR